MSAETRDPLQTRMSLLSRIRDLDDHEGWQQFFDTYWRLIHNVALKAGLRPDEADDVVQEVVLVVSRKIDSFRYDPARGSFKGWLLHTTRWRIADQFRARQAAAGLPGDRPDAIEQLPDPAGPALEAAWDEEWSRNLVGAGLERIRQQVSPLQYQIFDCYVIKEWPVADVMRTLGVSRNQVFLAKHRVGRALRREIRQLEERLF